MFYIIYVRFHWFPENVEHIRKHGVEPSDVEAIFRTGDVVFRQSESKGRWEAEGTVSGRLYRVAFTRPGPDEVYPITAFRIRRRRT